MYVCLCKFIRACVCVHVCVKQSIPDQDTQQSSELSLPVSCSQASSYWCAGRVGAGLVGTGRGLRAEEAGLRTLGAPPISSGLEPAASSDWSAGGERSAGVCEAGRGRGVPSVFPSAAPPGEGRVDGLLARSPPPPWLPRRGCRR